MVHTLNNNISHLINGGSTYVSSTQARYIAPVVGQTEVGAGNNCNAILFCLWIVQLTPPLLTILVVLWMMIGGMK